MSHPKTVEVVIEFELLGQSVGHWCDRCALPSVVKVDVVMTIGGGPTTMSSYRRCTNCLESGQCPELVR